VKLTVLPLLAGNVPDLGIHPVENERAKEREKNNLPRITLKPWQNGLESGNLFFFPFLN
jgi:hypothetical protein